MEITPSRYWEFISYLKRTDDTNYENVVDEFRHLYSIKSDSWTFVKEIFLFYLSICNKPALVMANYFNLKKYNYNDLTLLCILLKDAPDWRI